MYKQGQLQQHPFFLSLFLVVLSFRLTPELKDPAFDILFLFASPSYDFSSSLASAFAQSRTYISLDASENTSSTFLPVLADVSKNFSILFLLQKSNAVSL